MSKWKQMVLGDMGYTYGGLTNKTIVDFGFGKPFIPYMNIFSNGKINPKFLVLVNIHPGERQNTVKYGDLFFTTSSETVEEVGMTSVLLDDIGEAYLNSFCFGFRLNNFDDLLPEFAPFLFRGLELRKKISLFGQGSTRYNLPKTELLAKLKIDLPTIPDQRKIAKILSTTDTVIEKTQTAIAKYKAIKQGMLHDLFTRGIDIKTGKLRPKQEDAPELYKESELGWIPKEWDDKCLSSLCSEKPTYGINAAAVDYNHHLPTYLRITDIDEDGNFSKLRKKCVNSPFSNQYILKKGDLVFARTGATVGKTYLYNESDGQLVYAGFLIKVSPNDKILDSNFLKFLTETPYYINWVEVMSQRSGQPGINGNEYGNFLVPKPDLTEQKIIAETLLSIQNKISYEQQFLLKLQQIKSGLMADLLSGKKLVTLTEELEIQAN